MLSSKGLVANAANTKGSLNALPVLAQSSGALRAHSTLKTPLSVGHAALACSRPARGASAIRTAVSAPERPVAAGDASATTKPFKVLIAGAGIGGLVLATALLRKGIQVQVFERDFTAIRGEGKYRGPIQIQSNALAALEAIDQSIADAIYGEGCATGDRVNGLCDGLTGEWYVKFDMFHPAVDRGLPITRVICRQSLQQILAEHVFKYGGEKAIMGDSTVVDFTEGVDPAVGREQVTVTLEDGRKFSGDVLIGADGIRSRIRKNLIGECKLSYSNYTCYTGISDFTPANIDVVGYRVFLGNGQYFVTSDVGGGKMQWYGFHKEAAGGTDAPGQRKARLLQLFGHWNADVVDLIKATPEDDVLRRDIFDLPPVFTWSKGRTALLGDSAHAMQPNLGQGGCMAIEDAYDLAEHLASSLDQAGADPSRVNVAGLLQEYKDRRLYRVSVIHGMAGMAAFMASTYKAYLGEGLGPLEGLTKLGIHHPGRVIGGIVMRLTMPGTLDWVLGGNVENLAKSRPPVCKITDKPRCFDESQFPVLMQDDDAVLRLLHADWLLLTERASTDSAADKYSSTEAKGVYITEAGAAVGSGGAAQLQVAGASVAAQHARVWKAARGECWLEDLGSESGTWVNGRRVAPKEHVRLLPEAVISFGNPPESANECYKVKLQHESLRTSVLQGHKFSTLLVGQKASDLEKGAAAQASRVPAMA